MTKLLVSPRSVEEARTAAGENVDIIDVKNPDEGSLGANFPWIISQIREEVPDEIPVSAAIGDFPDLPGSASLAAFGALEAGADIIKVGLKGSKTPGAATSLMSKVSKSAKGNSDAVEVVACAYGDYERAGTLDPKALPDVGDEADVDYVMVDTAVKDGKPVTDFLTLKDLRNFTENAHSLNLKVALAGSLGPEEVEDLLHLEPDVIGVRGAVCEKGDRDEGKITKERIRKMREVLED